MDKPQRIVLSIAQLKELHADSALMQSFIVIMSTDKDATTLVALSSARYAKRQLTLQLPSALSVGDDIIAESEGRKKK